MRQNFINSQIKNEDCVVDSMVIMELTELKHLDNIDLLKYLAYLQICQENSSHLYTLQELQNCILRGENITSDENLWKKLGNTQTGLFVENYICCGTDQFRAFVADATERPWQLCVLVKSLLNYKKLSHKDLYTVTFFLFLSDKLATRLGLDYYVLGNYGCSNEIQILDIDKKKQSYLEFTEADCLRLANGRIETFDFINEYCCEKGGNVGLKPFLKTEKGYFILSPNALINAAWRELLKVMKAQIADNEIYEIYHASLAAEIHNTLAEKLPSIKELMRRGDNAYTAVFIMHNHRYIAVSVATKKTKVVDVDSVNPPENIDYLDISSHLKLMDKEIKTFDKDACVAHVVIPITMQNEIVFAMLNYETPAMMIQWEPLKALLKKDDDNYMWLYYYALDRSNTHVTFSLDAKEEDIIALYLKYKKSFYFGDKVTTRQMVYLEPGYALPLLFEIKHQANIHIVFDRHNALVVEREQDCPDSLPLYESRGGDFDMIVGEFMICNIFIELPKDTKERYPDLHAVGRSILLWYYATENSIGRPILMHNLNLSIESNESIKQGFLLENRDYFTIIKVSPNVLGDKNGHDLEQSLLTAVIRNADKVGHVLYRDYETLISDMFKKCQGGLIHRMSDQDLLCDTTIGERSYYVVDRRRKNLVIIELAEKFNHYTEGPLTLDESKKLVDSIIHYLNNRITTILERYDLEKLLTSLAILRDGLIFWGRTIRERYNSMISFYRFLGTDDPVQEKRIHEFVETDLCTRCLIEYALIKCSRHGKQDIIDDIDSIEEMFALMSELVNFGYLSDYYKSSSFKNVIEVLPNGRFAYPQDENIGLSKYAKQVTLDRLEHPAIYDKLKSLTKDLDYQEYEKIFQNVFMSEFGIEFNQFTDITTAIIQQMQDSKQGMLIEEIGSFRKRISSAAKVNEDVVNGYICAFSINSIYHDLGSFPIFKEHDTFPSRYKRKLGLMYRPICVFHSNGEDKITFSYRGFIQSQYNLLDNIRNSNYSSLSTVMGQYIGKLNQTRGKNFETGVYELYKQMPSLIMCHRSAQIGPKERLQNKSGALGDIDIMLIDNKKKKILLVEAKNYNECKTPYEAVVYEKKMLDDMKMVVKRDKWAKGNKQLFESYARSETFDYQVASIMLTFNLCPVKFFCDNYKTPLPIVWIRDVIEDPMSIFDFGNYS